MDNFFKNKQTLLFIILGGFFITNALVAEFIGTKIFSFNQTAGLDWGSWTIFGIPDISIDLSAGVLLWPVVFVMTDVINEYYGKKGVKVLTFLTVGLILYAFLMIWLAIGLPPADFWPTSHINPDLPLAEQEVIRQKVGDYNAAFGLVFRQGLWMVIASITAFLLGQFSDVFIFHKLKKITGEKKIWLRATGSTIVSQFFDTFIVLFIAFYIGADWSIVRILAIGLVGYSYKFFMAIALTPVIYGAHYLIERFLGVETAAEMKARCSLNP